MFFLMKTDAAMPATLTSANVSDCAGNSKLDWTKDFSNKLASNNLRPLA